MSTKRDKRSVYISDKKIQNPSFPLQTSILILIEELKPRRLKPKVDLKELYYKNKAE